MSESTEVSYAPKGKGTGAWGRLAHAMTLRLFVACFSTALLNMLFGFDTTSFAGVQSIPGFERQFGSEHPDGSYTLSGAQVSFMSSIGFLGKFFGTLVCNFASRVIPARPLLNNCRLHHFISKESDIDIQYLHF